MDGFVTLLICVGVLFVIIGMTIGFMTLAFGWKTTKHWIKVICGESDAEYEEESYKKCLEEILNEEE